MRLPFRLGPSRFTSTLLHVVFPTASLLVIASMFWIGFSGQREPLVQTASEAGGATNLTYSAQLDGGGNLKVRADSAVFLPTQIKASGVNGTIVYPDGHVRRFNSETANAGWDLSYAGFEGGIFTESPRTGSELTLWFATGSAGSNGLIGRQISATLETGEGTLQELVADQLFVKADGTSANVSGGATITWSGSSADDWFTVRSEGFEILIEPLQLESAGEAEFEFFGGTGKAGQLLVTSRESDAGETLELRDGVEFSYLDPVKRTN